MSELPIGVFDSGVGGLTVLAALRRQLPAESFLYLGDTARLPYGTKTHATVERYALQAVGELVRRGVKAVVVACNTASAAAMPALSAAYPAVAVAGSHRARCGGRRRGYPHAEDRRHRDRGHRAGRGVPGGNPPAGRQARVQAVAATLFVALAEEGWVTGEVAESIARRYLGPVFDGGRDSPDTLVLGCTHFPPLAQAIQCRHRPGRHRGGLRRHDGCRAGRAAG